MAQRQRIEDVNNELYGGLYSQMIYGESFEEPADESGVSGAHFWEHLPDGQQGVWSRDLLRPTWSRVGCGGSYNVSSESLHGNQSQFISNGAIVNYGLGQQGMYFVAGKDYEGSLLLKSLGAAQIRLALLDGDAVVASHTWHLDVGWSSLDFKLTANTSSHCALVQRGEHISCMDTKEVPKNCYLCSGGFQIMVQGEVLLDQAFLQPGPWGRFRNLPVRRDVVEAIQRSGWQTLRLGGSMCNAAGYRWKRFRGHQRQPYKGWWHPIASSSFRIFETLELCEAAEVQCVITLSNEESPKDMADFLEYCFASKETTWGFQRMRDGRQKPYQMFTLEIGNEQKLEMLLVQQVQAIAAAMQQRAEQLQLPMPRLVVGQNIARQLNFEGQGRRVTSAMLEVLKAFSSAWDAHIGGDAFEDVEDFKQLLNVSSSFFQQFGQTKMVVLEEYGFTHDLKRALNHARFNLAASYQGDFLLMNTAANGLQVFNQNDNGWDQGQIMMTPDKVWLSPYGWSQAMLSKHAKDFDVPLHVKIHGEQRRLEVGAYRSAKGVGLRLVHWEGTDLEVNITGRCLGALRFVVAEILTAPSMQALNSPLEPELVKPQPWPVTLLPNLLRLQLPGYALVTLELRELRGQVFIA